MMNIENARQDLINRGYNPDDFNIVKFDGGFSISPKPSFEQRKVAKEEDAPIKQDVDVVAELATINAMDKEEITELLLLALMRIDELEERLNG